MKKIVPRNFFVALCEYASQNNWCWNLYCTTCGHGAFKIAFSKIIKDQHPDSKSFWLYGKSNSDLLKDSENNKEFWGEASIANQSKLALIVANAKISDIQTISKFPDWLGYIGLVINHCSDRKTRKIISDALIPQFIKILKENEELTNYFTEMQSDGGVLSINDLSRIESGKVSLERSPIPLIFDIL